ncbi:MAG: hypothetical protein CMK24_09240 [Porticoccaceae bacterium]|nr:hypothetical protein [Porticoccaceae bacterium]
MKKYRSSISTIRHIMLESQSQSMGVVPQTRKRVGGDVTPIEKKKKNGTVDSTTSESFESRVDRIRNTIEEGSMGLERLERLSRARVDIDPAKVKYKVAQARAHESNPEKYQGNMDQNEKMTQHMGDQYARAEHLMPGDADHYKGQVMRAKNLKGAPAGEIRHFRSDGTDVTTQVNFTNSLGGEHHSSVGSQFTAHPEHKQMVQSTTLSSTVPPARAMHGVFTKTSDPQGNDPHIAVMAAYGGPHHPEGGAERTVEPLMMSISNFRSARANLPRGVALHTGGVPQDFINHAVGDNQHPAGLHRNG